MISNRPTKAGFVVQRSRKKTKGNNFYYSEYDENSEDK